MDDYAAAPERNRNSGVDIYADDFDDAPGGDFQEAPPRGDNDAPPPKAGNAPLPFA